MWLYVALSRSAYNLDRITRLVVEEVGSRAAIKAEIDGKTLMLAFYDSVDEAQVALESLLTRREAGASVVRL